MPPRRARIGRQRRSTPVRSASPTGWPPDGRRGAARRVGYGPVISPMTKSEAIAVDRGGDHLSPNRGVGSESRPERCPRADVLPDVQRAGGREAESAVAEAETLSRSINLRARRLPACSLVRALLVYTDDIDRGGRRCAAQRKSSPRQAGTPRRRWRRASPGGERRVAARPWRSGAALLGGGQPSASGRP